MLDGDINNENYRVLVVDDDSETLRILEQILAANHYQLAIFTRGDQALNAVRRFSPDAIILDIGMPEMDGYEICRRLKKEAGTSQIPVLFLSGMSGGDDIESGFQAGGVDFVAKPVCEQELLSRLSTQIRLHKAHDLLTKQHVRLRELEAYRDTLVHMLVHDMRSPLQAMLGHLQLIERGAWGALDADSRDSLSQTILATRLLSRLVSEIIDVNRLESQKMSMHCQSVNVKSILEGIVALEENRIHDHTLKLRVSTACPMMYADPLLVERVLLNLIDNALKYSPSSSEVVIGADEHLDGIRISIRDQGGGISEEDSARIFEKFAVGAKQGSQRKSSSGLGLAFCKLAVEAQGGTIGFENLPGLGCEFWIVMPRVLSS